MTVRSRRFVLAGLIVVGCYHAPAEFSHPADRSWQSAATPPVSGAALGCDAAIVAVLERDPTLRAARAGRAVAQRDVDAAGRWDGPELRLSDNLRDFANEWKAELRFPLPGPGVSGAENSAAEARVQLTAAEVRALEVQVAQGIRAAHADLAFVAARALLDREAAAAALRRAELVAERATAGTATAVAAMEAKLVAVAAEDTSRATEREVARHRERLTTRVGSPPDALVQCTAPRTTAGNSEVHPTIAIALAQAWESDAVAFAESRAAWIWPTFAQVGWAADTAGNNRQDRILVEVGIALPFPGADDGDVARSLAEQHRLAAEATRIAVGSAVDEAESMWREARAQRAALEARQGEIDAAAALLARAESAGAAPDELSTLSKRLRDHSRALAESEHALARAAAEVFAARGLAVQGPP